MTKAIDEETVRIMRMIGDLGLASQLAAATKEPTDYKKWSDYYDVMWKEIYALVGRANGLLTSDGLEQVAGGAYYSDGGGRHAGFPASSGDY